MTAKLLEKAGQNAIRSLRRKKLRQGIPFMINSRHLPTDQCYLEFPDGSIKIVVANSKATDFEVIENLSVEEIKSLRKKLNLA